MNRSQNVRARKQHQTGSKTKTAKAGKPHRGANLVAQKDASTKKDASRAAASRKSAKK